MSNIVKQVSLQERIPQKFYGKTHRLPLICVQKINRACSSYVSFFPFLQQLLNSSQILHKMCCSLWSDFFSIGGAVLFYELKYLLMLKPGCTKFKRIGCFFEGFFILPGIWANDLSPLMSLPIPWTANHTPVNFPPPEIYIVVLQFSLSLFFCLSNLTWDSKDLGPPT